MPGLVRDDVMKATDNKQEPFTYGSLGGATVSLVQTAALSTTPANVDEMARRARSAGITLKSDPHDTEWTSRAFEVGDPSGFLLTVYSEPSA